MKEGPQIVLQKKKGRLKRTEILMMRMMRMRKMKEEEEDEEEDEEDEEDEEEEMGRSRGRD